MPDAARLGDQMNHGGTIGPTVAATTVMIGHMPAATMGDPHVCPASDGPKPHVGGTILKGSPTVMICNKMAARMGDPAECKGPPNSIAKGCATVQIGDSGGGGGGGGGDGGGGGGPGGGDSGGEGGEGGDSSAAAGDSGAMESSSIESQGASSSGGGESEQSEQRTETTDLRVTVTDRSTGNPISGARVALSGQSSPQAGTTDNTGVARFTGIPAGSYRVEASHAGHQTGTTSANVVTNTTSTASVALQPLALEITDAAGNVLTGTQTKIVGQKIQLRVRTKPAGQTMTNIQWTIPGQTVKSYTQSTSTGRRTDLAAGDLRAADVGFHWIDGGDKQVRVSATVSGTTLTASVTFRILAPTGVTMTSVTGTVEVSNPGFPGAGLELHFGTNATPGVSWTCRATAPAGGAGQIAATQLDEVRHERTLNDGTRQTRNRDAAGVFRLDTSVPYDPAVNIAAGAQATWTSSDSPGGPLDATLRQYRSRANFRLYFMYKPDGADSIWVTIARLDWNWTGETTRVGAPAGTGNNWNAATNVANSTNPSGAASTELPTWTANVTGLSWQ